MTRPSACSALFALGSLVVIAPGATAQLREIPAWRTRGTVGVNVALANPTGEFGRFVQFGGGVGLVGSADFFEAAPLGMRFEATLLGYGSETLHDRVVPGIPRVALDVHTQNFIVNLGVGPQLTLGRGAVRPYAFGTAGVSYFATTSTVADVSDTNFDDVTFSLTGGAGTQIGLSRKKNPVSLDLSLQAVRNAQTRYLRDGSIRDLPDGSIQFTPIESRTNMVMFRAGVVVGLR